MKKLTLIAALFFGLTFVSVANSRIEIATAVQTTETGIPDMNPQVSISNSSATTTLSDSPQSANHKKKKSFKDKPLGIKILIIAGIAVFAVLCLLFGTVSVGI